MVKRIDKLTPEQEARIPEWVAKWTEIGLRTGEADWEKFERNARACYRYAGLDEPKVIVRVQSPIVLGFAAPIAACLLDAMRGTVSRAGGTVDADMNEVMGGVVDGAMSMAVNGTVSGAVREAVEAVDVAVDRAVNGAVRGAVGGAVNGAVGGAVRGAVNDAVSVAVYKAVDGDVYVAASDAVYKAVGATVGVAVGGSADVAVREAVDVAVEGAVSGAVDGAASGAGDRVSESVNEAVDAAVRGALYGAVNEAVNEAIRAVDESQLRNYLRQWSRYIGGQFWVGGWYWGSPSWVSFFQDVCGLELPGDLGERARALQGTAESACWWWPHRQFVMVCARPRSIHRDDRGRLHNDSGPAIDWPDGWGVYAIHGVRVPADIVEHPEAITTERINVEPNAEVRRVMLDRFGIGRYLRESKAKLVSRDDWGTLWQLPAPTSNDDPLLIVEVLNSTPEPDGSFKTYFLSVHPECRPMRRGVLGQPQKPTPLNAIASTYGMTGEQYGRVSVQT